ncbi:oxygenase MpaB family protein [Nocardiopsis sp. SBT366]|uniref:oxygenase MpaB family protein n=1 Tax=Nocardiopsis sp. SBT366 TaxID=1580529 RepID=UPI00066BF94F|nr:oxygenase MpaB family protein [Nocardiopsis sp. SBT366]
MDLSHAPPVLRRLNTEASILAGAGYAILLQVAHPSVARGVAEHSDFAARPLDRLRGTLYYVYGTALGTPEERERVQAIVRAVHRRVRGPGYDALDPELLMWIGATLYHSAVRVYEMTVTELTEEEHAQFLRETSVYATALGLPQEWWPQSIEEFSEYWENAYARLEVGPDAVGLSEGLFRPNNRLLWPMCETQRFLSGGLLEPELREQFGIPWSEARQRRFERLIRLTRRVYPRLPKAVRSLPSTLYLRSMRKNGGWKPTKPSKASKSTRPTCPIGHGGEGSRD